jgi:hypothetical protein
LERYYLDYTLYNKYYLVFIKGVGNWLYSRDSFRNTCRWIRDIIAVVRL